VKPGEKAALEGVLNAEGVELKTNPTASLIIQLEHGEEGFLGHFHVADLAHTFLSFFLFFEEFPLPCDVAAVTFGGDVFPDGLNGFAGDDLGANGRLYGDIELLARNQFF
jgi:hypothetical protein